MPCCRVQGPGERGGAGARDGQLPPLLEQTQVLRAPRGGAAVPQGLVRQEEEKWGNNSSTTEYLLGLVWKQASTLFL